MNRRVIGAVAAVLLAAVGTLVLVVYVRGAEDRALAGERLVDVLVVREAIAKGTRAEDLVPPRIERERVPVKVRIQGGVTDLTQLRGQVAAVDLLPGEQLVAGRFEDPKVLATQGDVEIPPGSQQVTISLEPERAVGGQIRPGDTVGFFASLDGQTGLILHKILVTNVQGGQAAQGEGQQSSQAPGGSLLLTLAVDAAQAERVVFVAEHGTIWLSAEPPEASEAGTRVQTGETIYQ